MSKGWCKILLILDNAAEAPRIFSPINHEYVPSYLGDLADFWGIRFRNDSVVTDLDNSIMVDATKDYKNNPSFTRDVVQFILTEKNVNPKANIEILNFSLSKQLPLVAYKKIITKEDNTFNAFFEEFKQDGELSTEIKELIKLIKKLICST